MRPDEWRQVKEVLQEALERDAAERTTYLDAACGEDVELRRQVEALLASERTIGQFLAPSGARVASAFLDPTGSSTGITEPETFPDWPCGRRIGPYDILQTIGHGGMSTVCLAERADGQYRKRVAIKFVKLRFGAEDILRRFRQERQVLADLDHPNIARLLDGGETEDGLPYLIMEHVQGERIDVWCDGRKLPVRDRLKLFRSVCAAVEYAHDKQVIHRDIKPSNILATADGTPKLLDFGIAKVLKPKLSGETVETLGPGPMTPEYASPEQVRGERIGPASDIYSLGVVLYRLLTGQSPYALQGNDVSQMARAICEQAPAKPSVASGNRQLAGDLDNILLMALRKEPERRYASAAELSEDIHRFLSNLPVHACKESLSYRCRKFLKRNRILMSAIVLTGVLVLSLAVGLERFWKPRIPSATGVRSIAVLPFENLSGDKDQEYFADGITDALINDLARIRGLRVISRTSAMLYKGSRQPLPEIARTLGVETIAEGSVFRSGNRVRIAIRVVDAQKDQPLWSGSYEGELQDVLTIQSRVADAVAEEVHVTLTRPEQARASRSQRVDLAAYDAYLKGQRDSHSGYYPEMNKAIEWFQQAIALDPNYAPAYAGLARSYYGVSNVVSPPTDVMPKAKSAALRAIGLDPMLAEAHAILAEIRAMYDFDHAGAEKEFERALELKPGDAEAHEWHSLHLVTMGRFDEALAEAERVANLGPASTHVYQGVPWVLYYARRYNEVVQRMQSLIEKDPNYRLLHVLPGLAWEQEREWAKAIPEMEKAYDPKGTQMSGLAALGHLYAVAGRTEGARKLLRRVLEESKRRYVPAFDPAILYAGLGERDEAFRWLQKAYEDRSEKFAYIGVDPRFDTLHYDPRWAGVLRNAGLSR